MLRPKIMAGLVESWEMHRRFELLPADTYCGLRLPAAHYTPDFFITYQNGVVEVVALCEGVPDGVAGLVGAVDDAGVGPLLTAG
mgnify:CR=1 FL=1